VIRQSGIRFLLWLAVLLAALPLHALDRNAFTFTRYSLQANIRPAEHEFHASGTIELRNDSTVPQKEVPLQISSSLSWQQIQLEGQPVAYIKQSYTSDIDHTGELQEAIVTLPEALAPGGTLKLEVSYGGEITRSSGRLTRIGTPEGTALQGDWDEIGGRFGAVRGLGYVVWYPVSMEAVSLSDGNAIFDAIARWKHRHEQTAIHVALSLSLDAAHAAPLSLVTSGRNQTGAAAPPEGFSSSKGSRVTVEALETDFQASSTPVFAFGEFVKLDGLALTVLHAPEQDDQARAYADSAEQAERVLADWFGPLKNKPQLVALRDPNASPFESGKLLLVPLRPLPNEARQLLLARMLVHGSLTSPRKWISEGLSRFGQALVRERQTGRASANEFLAQVLPVLIQVERAPEPAGRAERDALINSDDEIFYRGKAAYVWWMLRDMVGDTALTKAIAAYRPGQDQDAAYMQRLIEAQFTPRRNLQAFFDAWVYHDYGLPDLRVDAANARPTLENNNVVSVTIENLTRVWVEVPVMVRDAGGDVRTARLQVPGNAKSTTRISFQGTPATAEVNDGSVPELDLSNNRKQVLMPGQPSAPATAK
jgi:hypothetical protein